MATEPLALRTFVFGWSERLDGLKNAEATGRALVEEPDSLTHLWGERISDQRAALARQRVMRAVHPV